MPMIARSLSCLLLGLVSGAGSLSAVEPGNPAIALTARAAPSAEALATRYAAQRASVLAASRVKTSPERLSPDFPPKPFLMANYLADRDAYLGVIEPGRCWRCAQDDATAPVLEAVGGRSAFSVLAGGAVDLSLVAPVGAPVSLSSFDGGNFPNGLNSITVEADANGRATTTWTASPGTVEGVRIVAASPLARDTVSFAIQVQGPTTAPPETSPSASNGGAK